MIHRIDKERESCRKYRSKKGVRCDGAGGVALKVVNQVVECALEYGKESKAYQTSSNTRRNPRNFSAGCPAKKEETTSEDNRAHHLRSFSQHNFSWSEVNI